MSEIKLAIFDMDGTIFENYLNWQKIREELSVEDGSSILQNIFGNGTVNHRSLEILEKYERENTLKTKPIDGVNEFISYLARENIAAVLVTNNNRENTDFLLEKFNIRFDLVITREMKLWKPEPEAFFYAMNYYGCKADESISIGDSHYDIMASRGANITGIFIIENGNSLPKNVNIENEPGVTFFTDYRHLKKILTPRGGGLLWRAAPRRLP